MGGASLVLGPLLLLTGVLLRLRFDFFFPAQLSAYGHHPGLMTASYSFVSAGWVLLWPGVVLLAAKIGERFRELALWGGALTVLGLFARAFHAGVDHLAFQLVAVQGGGIGDANGERDLRRVPHLQHTQLSHHGRLAPAGHRRLPLPSARTAACGGPGFGIGDAAGGC